MAPLGFSHGLLRGLSSADITSLPRLAARPTKRSWVSQ